MKNISTVFVHSSVDRFKIEKEHSNAPHRLILSTADAVSKKAKSQQRILYSVRGMNNTISAALCGFWIN